MRSHVRITDAPLSIAAAQHFCTDPAAGAIVAFTGTVRNTSEGRDVRGLSYEAYAERAEAQMSALAEQAFAQWPDLRALFAEHRVGELSVGEPAVVVAVAAGHREAAFDAARWMIDTLKATVAIWKEEHWADGGRHWPGLSTP